jgi:hypothetical protein
MYHDSARQLVCDLDKSGMLQRDRCVLLKCFAHVCINVTPWMVYDTEGIRRMLQRDRCVLLKCLAYVCICDSVDGL